MFLSKTNRLLCQTAANRSQRSLFSQTWPSHVSVKSPICAERHGFAVITNWHKEIGGKVQKDEIIGELELDKINIDIHSSHDGVLVSRLEIGSRVTNHCPMGVVECQAP